MNRNKLSYMSRGKKLYNLALKATQENLVLDKEDDLKKNKKPKPIKNLFAPVYLDYFDKGKWEELDNYLKLDLSLKKVKICKEDKDKFPEHKNLTNRAKCDTPISTNKFIRPNTSTSQFPQKSMEENQVYTLAVSEDEQDAVNFPKQNKFRNLAVCHSPNSTNLSNNSINQDCKEKLEETQQRPLKDISNLPELKNLTYTDICDSSISTNKFIRPNTSTSQFLQNSVEENQVYTFAVSEDEEDAVNFPKQNKFRNLAVCHSPNLTNLSNNSINQDCKEKLEETQQRPLKDISNLPELKNLTYTDICDSPISTNKFIRPNTSTSQFLQNSGEENQVYTFAVSEDEEDAVNFPNLTNLSNNSINQDCKEKLEETQQRPLKDISNLPELKNLTYTDICDTPISTNKFIRPNTSTSQFLQNSIEENQVYTFAVSEDGSLALSTPLQAQDLVELHWTPPLKEAPSELKETQEHGEDREPLAELLPIEEDLPEAGDTMAIAPKKKKRNDRKNFCIFCENMVTNFRRHLLRVHKKEQEVLKYTALLELNQQSTKKQRLAIFDNLRRRGNCIHNLEVMRKINPGSSDRDEVVSKLLPVRRPQLNSKKSYSDFLMCPNCQELYSKSTFFKHSKECCTVKDNGIEEMVSDEEEHENVHQSAKRLRMQGIPLHPNHESCSKILNEKIVPVLKKDMFGMAGLEDPLISNVVSDYVSNHLEEKDKYYATKKLRDGGRLLLKMKEMDNQIVTLSDCLSPMRVYTLLSAIQELCLCDTETGEVKKVGMPARLSWVVKECAAKMIENTISNPALIDTKKEQIKTQVADFLHIFKRRWRFDIGTNAEKSRKKLTMIKPIVMADDNDIKVLGSKLRELELKYFNILKTTVVIANYENLCKVTIAHIILLNRRRSGEAARAELSFYLNRSLNDHFSDSIQSTLTDTEKSALHNLSVFMVPGKRVRAVPILLTKQMESSIDLIVSCRKELGINASNLLLFARPSSKEPFDGPKIMREMRNLCKLNRPQDMTATGLRHHCATMSQVEKSSGYVEHLAEFMGHDTNIHKKNYRFPLPVIQRGHIGTNLLEMEGSIECNKGGSGDHPELVTPAYSSLTDSQSETANTDLDNKITFHGENVRNVLDCSSVAEIREEILTDAEANEENVSSSHAKKRKRWSEDEKAIVLEAFADCVRNGTNPGTARCTNLIKKNPLLKGRTWTQVNVLIDNFNKKKTKLPKEFSYLLTN